jgi:PAS domain S-box-containing protein
LEIDSDVGATGSRRRAGQVAIAVAGVFLLTVLWGAAWLAARVDEDRARGALTSDTVNLALAFERQTVSEIAAVDRLVSSMKDAIEDRDPARLWRLLETASQIDGTHVVVAAVAGADGTLVANSLPFRPLSIADLEHFRVHVERDSGKAFVSRPLLGRVSGRWSIHISRRVNAADGTFGGVVTAALDLDSLAGFYRQLDLGQDGFILLAGVDGVVRAFQGRTGFRSDYVLAAEAPALHALLQSGALGSGVVDRGGGARAIVSFRRLDAHPLVVAVGVSERDVAASTAAARRNYVIAAASGSLLSIGIGIALAQIARRERQRGAERLESARRLGESEQRFRDLTELSADWWWEQGPDYRFVAMSYDRELGGLPVAATIGRTRWELPGTTPIDTTWEAHRAVLDARKAFRALLLRREVEGGVHYLSVSGKPVFAADGTFAGYRGVASDITAQRVLEQRYRDVFDQAAVGIVETSFDGRYQRVNRKFCEMLGYREDELVGRLAADITHPEDRNSDPRRQELLAGSRKSFTGERRYLRRDGRVIWVSRTVSLAHDEAGRPLHFIRIIEDISERRAAEERYRATFDSAPVGILHTSIDNSRVLKANRRACAMLGYTEAELLSMTAPDLVHPDYRFKDRERYADQLIDPQAPSFASERLYVRKDGSSIWVRRTVSVVRDASGTPEYFIRIIEDITAARQQSEALARLNAELEQRVEARTADLLSANRELEAFAYSISHDLRAPLRAIDSFSRIAMDETDAAPGSPATLALERVRANAQRMGQLIDDLLGLSRIGRATLKLGRVDLSMLATAVGEELRESDPDRTVQMVVQPGVVVVADANLLRIALGNLVGNAWKFTRNRADARIEIGAETVGGETVCFVRDNGAGFDMRFVEKLFGPFQRLHGDAEFPGTGIGLAIVERVVRRHGGWIRAEGEVGKGATIRFTLGGGNR